MILTIAGRELRSLFLSPLAWSVLAVVQLILAYVFLIQVELFIQWQPRLAAMEGAPGATDIIVSPLFRTAAIVLLLVVPLLTMRLVSEERRARTLTLLLSAPASMTQIVLGKYLGVMGFLVVLLGLTVLMPLSLVAGGNLDWGLLASGAIGLALVVAAFAAAGLFLSTLTDQPTVAGVSTFGLLLLLWILDWAGGTGNEAATEAFTYLSLLTHYDALLKGVFDSQDVVYYVLFSITFLVLGIRRLDAERLQE
ncbi:MAG: ABC transporter permease subunit [Gammaproteobacteria bacterium]|nr:ABC transporter permease subunit [Gammaproteobacteria bacterium]